MFYFIVVGLNFAILFVWVLISAVTLPTFQWLARRSEEKKKLRGPRKGAMLLVHAEVKV